MSIFQDVIKLLGRAENKIKELKKENERLKANYKFLAECYTRVDKQNEEIERLRNKYKSIAIKIDWDNVKDQEEQD